MRQEIIEVTNEHFQWVIVDGVAVKEKLSNNLIIKQVVVTYDDNDVEIGRENYVPETKIDASKIDIDSVIVKLKEQLVLTEKPK